jgi:septal ring factor EnvC (AmiA/AmiB activator)
VRRLVPALALSALLAGALQGALAQDDEEARARQQLDRLKREIASLSEDLKADLAQRSSLRDALRKSEIAIGVIRRKINDTRARLTRNRAQLENLQAQRRELLVARGRQQELIGHEIETAYQMGKQAQLRVLLNQEDPATLARAMTYYDYFYQARLEHIRSYLQIVERIDVLEPEINQASLSLEATRKTLDSQESELVTRQRQRQQELAQLNATIDTKDQRLQKLGQDREELERLLEVIEQAVAEMEVPDAYQAFARVRGEMPWPVRGKPSNRYGARRGQGSLKWQGLVIPAQEGSGVNAIHHGRVVFADWFRGSGLLLIIDHGDGYMSLYAHNESLLRDVGEWVSAGSSVATVGNSGGRAESALYFEIRKDGKPTNPANWLK